MWMIMNKYGFEVLSCDRLDYDFISRIDFAGFKKNNSKIVIQVLNTSHIDKRVLKILSSVKNKYNLDIKISVIGPYDERLETSPKRKQKSFYKSLYEVDELYEIIGNLENIESKIDSNWSKIEKLVYLIETLIRNIMYDPEYRLLNNKGLPIPTYDNVRDLSDYYDRSLRGLLTKKSVCAGYSVILKELADRCGIECRLVSGACYDDSGQYRGGHAWNLVVIDGVTYPIDITKRNTKFRYGEFTNIEDISCDIEKFKRTHRPYNPKNNIGLTRLDEDTIKRAQKKTMLRKHYKASTFILQRHDGSKFVISQIGMFKGLYRYLVYEMDSSGKHEEPTVYFSESNLIKEIQQNKFELTNHFNEFINSFTNVLLSKSNIADSKRLGTYYIGHCERDNGNGFIQDTSEIKKNDRHIKAFSFSNIKSKRRLDGSVVTLVQVKNNVPNNQLYQYYVYVLSNKGTLMEYVIFSNEDYFTLKPSVVVNEMLSDDVLRQAASTNGIVHK